MDEETIPIIVLGLGFAALVVSATKSPYIQGSVAGIPRQGYDITQKEPAFIIPLSKQKGGIPPPPQAATRPLLSKAGTQMPYGTVPANIGTPSLISPPVKPDIGGPGADALSGGPGKAGQGGPTAVMLGPSSLKNPNTPPDVKTMLANAPPDF
jgi:hypothetical protein